MSSIDQSEGEAFTPSNQIASSSHDPDNTPYWSQLMGDYKPFSQWARTARACMYLGERLGNNERTNKWNMALFKGTVQGLLLPSEKTGQISVVVTEAGRSTRLARRVASHAQTYLQNNAIRGKDWEEPLNWATYKAARACNLHWEDIVLITVLSNYETKEIDADQSQSSTDSSEEDDITYEEMEQEQILTSSGSPGDTITCNMEDHMIVG
ncbi:hypothetical protein TREMEDRAFT_65592 [Tremella mesenterica DSM 1558]|uniref:uncharacterized protein n=1 Tax=Tremella mesenterica (strain ATCC 24925 / CBS 8224 / DSM 1558 / NBRC 9311 / NRRL Y-6157 / RJB 2259-6 / UBC 559-6) TaxID=578456 RepID=UPI00032B9FE8|nr:uncharacterized protein TREMEDRAFT_65592 [Tremella mesenterica DSM 1558]EIW66321.1 hypothetical protein TREMEDRAFT_65592 [Tremella mesenterica DSM 1558]